MEKEEEDGQEAVFSLLYFDGNLWQFSLYYCTLDKGSSFYLAFDPPYSKLCLPISLNLTDAQVIFYKMSVKEHCQIRTTRLSQIFFHLVKD